MPPARCGQHPGPDDRNPRDSKIYDPGAVPEWARESIAQIARDHPESLAHWLGQVAEIEAAKQRAPRDTSQAPPLSARDTLHLAAIQAWQAIASGRPAPRLDLLALYQAIYEAFETSGSQNPSTSSTPPGKTSPASTPSPASTAICCPTWTTPSPA